jgi:hypothetical protein
MTVSIDLGLLIFLATFFSPRPNAGTAAMPGLTRPVTRAHNLEFKPVNPEN